ncbi:MAG: hypothetical protein LAO24_11785 [Acidobacteriia bacterium]|nr:hypothetical protein [Terriglobia bacterium]
MKTNAQSIRGTAANLLVASIVALTGAVHAQTPTVLYNFGTNSGDPLQPVPQAALTQGRDGNMYGTTQYGGAHGNGAVFKIDASGNTSVVYSFPSTPGAYYCVAGLVLGNDGNFYGVCVYGSTDKGSVYKVTPGGTRKVLHTFSGPDGDTPRAPLLLAADGNFYGTTTQGGANGFGTVYRMAPGGTLTTIYSFNSTDGANPVAPLIQATDGNLYGTTQNGGANGYGETFKITPAGKLTVLHSFTFTDGAQPTAALSQSSFGEGDFYGNTAAGGANANGVIFDLTPGGTYNVLHNFNSTTDGAYPYVGMVQGPDSNFYGVTPLGGVGLPNGMGTLFSITTAGVFNVLYYFDGTLGENPASSVLLNTNGLYYGDTESGGTASFGTFYTFNEGPVPFCILQPSTATIGSKVGIIGQGFSSTSVVDIGGDNATNFTVTGSTFINAAVPPNSGTGYVTVTTGTTTLFCNKAIKIKPVISGFTPTSGPVGTVVTINGSGLGQALVVKFGSTRARPNIVSNSQVTAKVPNGAVSGKITITTPGGTATSAGVFTVN